jgi:hypothetical protein
MKIFAKLTLLTLLVIALLGVYFEFCVNRPLNLYLQYVISAVVIIGTVFYVVYLVKQIIKILNP